MTRRIGGRRVNIYHYLDTVFSAPFNSLVPDIVAVHVLYGSTVLIKCLYKFGVGVSIDLYHRVRLSVLPLQYYLGGHGYTKQIEAVICDKVKAVVHISRPHTVKHLTANVVAEPVYACHPDRVAVHINDFGVFIYMKPVIVVAVGCRCRRCS